jgi:hypothetical protein
MAMDKNVTHIVGGVIGGKAIQSLIRWQGDLLAASMLLYPPTKYVTDLKAAGYITASTKTDAEIGAIVMQTSGFPFDSGPGGLRGNAKLTADPYTYQAAAGQKIPAWQMPSTWLSGILGVVGIADGYTPFMGKTLEPYKLVIAAAGASMLADGVSHGLGVDGCITAPSGFDVSKQPILQNLDQSVVNNLKVLASDNSVKTAEINRLNAELARLKGLPQPVPTPGITVREVGSGIPEPQNPSVARIKTRSGLLGGALATNRIRNPAGLQTIQGTPGAKPAMP